MVGRMSTNITCYDTQGTAAPGNHPCGFPNQLTCCGFDWDCLDNGLCRQHGTTSYSQGTCTDPSYGDCLSFCNQRQFDGFTEVSHSHCEPNGNNWCCAGATGQGLGGPDCCDTNRTTSLEPYPFTAIENSGQSVVARSSVSPDVTLSPASISSTTITSSPSRSSSLSTSLPSSSQIFLISTQALATTSQTSVSSPSPQSNQPSRTVIEIAIPVAIVIILLAVLAFFIF